MLTRSLAHRITVVFAICLLILENGCSFNEDLTLARGAKIIATVISGVEYQVYISIGKRIGATAEEPEKFLKELGIIDYIIREEPDHTWYVESSLTDKGKKILKPVKTIWGPRYATTIAKLKLEKVDRVTVNPDRVTAVLEAKFKVEPTDSELAHYLSPAKSVFENHNIHIACLDVKGLSKIPWGVPKERPYKIQLRKVGNQWTVEKLLAR